MWCARVSPHARMVIAPALEAGKPVICDRYADSTTAYQGGGRVLDMDFVNQLNEVAMGGCRPDVTVYLDVTAAEGERRCRARSGVADRLEEAGLSFQERVRQAYRRIAARDPRGSVWVDGLGEPGELSDTIYRELRWRWPQFPFGE